jgi:hypothetical protein
VFAVGDAVADRVNDFAVLFPREVVRDVGFADRN